MAIFDFLWLRYIPSNCRSSFFSKFDCSVEWNSQNGIAKMKMLRSEFPSNQSLPHERKIFQTDNYRSHHRRCSVKQVLLKISQISQENTYFGVPFYNKVAVPRACNFIEKRLQHKCFPMKFTKILRTSILKNITGNSCF